MFLISKKALLLKKNSSMVTSSTNLVTILLMYSIPPAVSMGIERQEDQISQTLRDLILSTFVKLILIISDVLKANVKI